MSRPPQKAGKHRIRNREKTGQALELRKAGGSYQAIGDALGLSKTQAHRLVTDGLAELEALVGETAEEVRRIELERLDALYLALYPQRKNPRAVDSLLRISERRAKLLGIDAPTRQEFGLKDLEEKAKFLREVADGLPD